MASDLALAATVAPFQADSDPTTTAQRWKKWTDRFENLMIALNLTDAARKKALLLHLAGESVQETFDGLVIDPIPDDADSGEVNVYTQTRDALNNFFAPSKNVVFEVYNFRLARQTIGESTDAFHARLRNLAQYCQFDDADNEIKAQIIQTCLSTRLRRYALAESNLSLKTLLDKARSMEAAERQVKVIENGAQPTVAAIRRGQGRQQQASSRQPFRRSSNTETASEVCRNCGGAYPHPGGRSSCPAYNRECRGCKKLHHFQRMCQSSGSTRQTLHQPNRAPPPIPRQHPGSRQRSHRRGVHQLNELSGEVNTDTDEEDYTFSVGDQTDPKKLPMATATVNNDVSLEFLIDTGASVNCVSEALLEKFKVKPCLEKPPSKIYAYGSKQPLQTVGVFHAQIAAKCKVTKALVYVVKGKFDSLLSYKTARDLELVKLNINSVQPTQQQISIDQIEKQYPKLFSGIGCLKDFEVKLHIDTYVKPVAQPHRRIPFHLQEKVKSEIKLLLDQGIIEQVRGPTPWLSNIVTPLKPNDPSKVRICLDMRIANSAIQRTRYVLPTLDDIIADLQGMQYVSHLDISHAYHQLMLSESSRDITTFSCGDLGLFRYRRLFFGICSASEIFQNTIAQVLAGIPGCRNAADDILIAGRTIDEHNSTLHRVLQRLQDNGLTLNKKKCSLMQTELDFWGIHLSQGGISISPTRVEALRQLKRPNNAAEVRSLLGMTGWSSRFIKDYAAISAPLRELTRQNTKWKWSQVEENAFRTIIDALSKSAKQAFFDRTRRTQVIVDASPIAVSAALTQIDPATQHSVVLCHSSRALSAVESRYSQFDREMLAVVFGIVKYHRWIYGSEFDVLSDNKALCSLLNNKSARMTARVERMFLKLQGYRFKMMYIEGRYNPVDYTSRKISNVMLTASTGIGEQVEQYINFVIDQTVPKYMARKEIAAATVACPTLSRVITCIQSGKWHELSEVSQCRPYYNIRDELSTSTDDDGTIVLRGRRIVLPEGELPERAVQTVTATHLGIVAAKRLLRSKVWFVGLDKMVEKAVKSCIHCQASTLQPSNIEPLKMSQTPSDVFSEISIDFLTVGGQYIMVVICDLSRYPICRIIPNVSADVVITEIDDILSMFGNVKVIRTDRGSPWNSQKFKDYLEFWGIRHRAATPLYPQGDGIVERFMRCLNKVLRTSHSQGSDWRKQLNAFLRDYRATPHSMTGIPPGELMFKRSFRTRLPECNDVEFGDNTDRYNKLQEAKMADQRAKAKVKHYGDKNNHAKHRQWEVGSKVLVKQQRENKFTTFYEAEPYTIIGIHGSSIRARRDSDGRMVFRNSSHYKLWKPPESTLLDADDDEYSVTQFSQSVGGQQVAAKPESPPSNRLMDTNNKQTTVAETGLNDQSQSANGDQQPVDGRYHLRSDRKQNTRLKDYYVYHTVEG